MSFSLDFSAWVTNASDWLTIVNDSTHGALDILIAFVIGSAALYFLYNYLTKASGT